ncbi:MAG: ATP-grasp domain-containing protein [Rhodomicrobiaceae bacterium]
MNFLEHVAKAHVLKPAGVPVPASVRCASPDEAAVAFAQVGPCVVKAQVPTGKRGKAGGIKKADSAEEASRAAAAILGMTIDGHKVESVLLEKRAAIARELYAAVMTDFPAAQPLILFSTEGGMDIEEVAATRPDALRRLHVALSKGLTRGDVEAMLDGLDLGAARTAIADTLAKLYNAYRETDAELIEINPLAILEDGSLAALDCKLTIDDASAERQRELTALAAPEKLTELEARARDAGLKFIELDGDVGLLANGAGLTMTTMDVIAHFGGRPANFLEIGGEAYTKSETALGLVLSHRQVKSLVVNFCGAFARTDVMADGVTAAWKKLNPSLPVFFSVHGTGEDEAVAMIRERLGIEPYDFMEDAVKAAVEAAK